MDREKIVGNLYILRTWCAVNPKYGMALSVEDCDKAVGWLDDAIALLKAQEPIKPLKMEVDHVRKEPVVFSYECPVCMCGLQRHWVACPICGKAVKWE